MRLGHALQITRASHQLFWLAQATQECSRTCTTRYLPVYLTACPKSGFARLPCPAQSFNVCLTDRKPSPAIETLGKGQIGIANKLKAHVAQANATKVGLQLTIDICRLHTLHSLPLSDRLQRPACNLRHAQAAQADKHRRHSDRDKSSNVASVP